MPASSGRRSTKNQGCLSGVGGARGREHDHVGRAPRGGRRQCMLEVFAGCARLSGACWENGLRTYVPIELQTGQWHDVTSPRVLRVLLGLIGAGKVWLVHVGTPCTKFSRARTTGKSDSRGGRLGELCYRASLRILRVCKRQNIFVSVENPASSDLWNQPELRRMHHDKPTRGVCQDGHLPIWSSLQEANHICQQPASAVRVCRTHLLLPAAASSLAGDLHEYCGRRRVSSWLTAAAGRYPPALCRAYAECARRSAPNEAFLLDSELELNSELLQCLASAGGHDGKFSCEPTRCPRRFSAGPARGFLAPPAA